MYGRYHRHSIGATTSTGSNMPSHRPTVYGEINALAEEGFFDPNMYTYVTEKPPKGFAGVSDEFGIFLLGSDTREEVEVSAAHSHTASFDLNNISEGGDTADSFDWEVMSSSDTHDHSATYTSDSLDVGDLVSRMEMPIVTYVASRFRDEIVLGTEETLK